MKILMFGWEFPPHNSGGLGVACQGLVKALSKKGLTIHFVLPRRIDVEKSNVNFHFADQDSTVSVHYINSLISSPYNTSLSKGGVESKFSLINEVKLYTQNAKKLAKTLDFDIIHAHDWLSFGAGIAAKEISGKPLVAHIHATEFDRNGGNGVNEFIYQQEDLGFKQADKIIAVSEYTKEVVNQNYEVKPSKIVAINNGIDFDEIDRQEGLKMKVLDMNKKLGYKIVLFLGRLTLQKNPEALLRAAQIILEYEPKTIFIFAGSGDLEATLINQAAEKRISDKVIFAGFIRGKEKDELYKAADVFVMPSISEPFGLVALESMVNNTPIIVSKQSGVAYALRSSLKVDFWDVDDLANNIIAVLRNKPLKDELSQNGNAEARNFTWDRAADNVIDVYTELVS